MERRLYHCKVPTWLIRLVKHRERRPGPQGGGVCRPYDGDGGGNKRILNPNQKAECKLSDGEQFKYLFTQAILNLWRNLKMAKEYPSVCATTKWGIALETVST